MISKKEKASPSPLIGISSGGGGLWAEYVPILQGVLPDSMKFVNGSSSECAGEIIFNDFGAPAPWANTSRIPNLQLRQSKMRPDDIRLRDIVIQFADDADVPFPFRGRSLQTKVSAEPETFSLTHNEKALATWDGQPVWTVLAERGVRQFKSGFALPHLPPASSLIDVLNGERFLEMLPLLHWLQEICGTDRFHGPPLRACFIFDDPNLHWRRYGFVNFHEIATRAAKENYHVSFATIPLDSWFTHRDTAEVFRKNPERLSLCVHGNNHIRGELARDFTEAERISLLKQAIRRIERLERNAGLRVCRVMVPPHGACSEAMLADIARCGFDAACISHGSLRAHNKGRAWTKSLGILPSELIQGCPVLPRWGLTGATTNSILLAAFLRQPIVIRGHQQDLKDGVELLDNLSGFINELGCISWTNVTGLSRANYQWQMAGDTCTVRPLSRKIMVRLPEEASSLIIEDPSRSGWGSWQVSGGNGSVLNVRAGESFALGEKFKRSIEIETAAVSPVPVCALSDRSSATALFRRLFTESRDRLLAWS